MLRLSRSRDSFKNILAHPFIVQSEKQKLLHATLGEYATPLLERFLTLLVSKRRFDLLSEIVQEFNDRVDRANNVQALRVRSAFPMTEPEKRTLQQKLEKWLSSKVRMDIQVDP